MLKHFLVTLVLGTGYGQLVHDGTHLHVVFRNRHDKVVGGYSQLQRHDPFVAQCNGRQAVVRYSLKQAEAFVEACPGAKD